MSDNFFKWLLFLITVNKFGNIFQSQEKLSI